ncbi:Hypothetical protein BRZCDTV_239 [Brazilian cedratvirus IHUMI]|uniref:F-box domain-containing protein n=1 Tax=Brazilian cedratvirus IHUMI TaxID=2126980 RepID=A0A2R8FEI4_9VIRU|nr:Hypothetical protein BRZCDTV_239 [Brazilian cedratvirus IHUMI]
MDSVLFCVLCHSSAPDLFTLSSVCRETRSIFIRKSFWKARFSLLDIEHDQPSLQVYLHYLQLEKQLRGCKKAPVIFYMKLDLDMVRKSSATKELIDNLDRAEREGRPGKYLFYMQKLQILFDSYFIVEKKAGKYTLSTKKSTLVLDRDKTQILNLLLALC